MSVANNKELMSHKGHQFEIGSYLYPDGTASSVTIECWDCGEVLLEPFPVGDDTSNQTWDSAGGCPCCRCRKETDPAQFANDVEHIRKSAKMSVATIDELMSAMGHQFEIGAYLYPDGTVSSVTIECLDCGEVLLEPFPVGHDKESE